MRLAPASCVTAWLSVVLAGSLVVATEDGKPPIELCVRGDDMGHALDVNRAFVKAHTEGILTSASVMPPAPYFDDAVARLSADFHGRKIINDFSSHEGLREVKNEG